MGNEAPNSSNIQGKITSLNSNNHHNNENSNQIVPNLVTNNNSENNNTINNPQQSEISTNTKSPESNEEPQNPNPRIETNANIQLSESAAKYQHYLKFLYKNNFVSLTYEDWCAFMAQYHWRRHFISKIKKARRGYIDVIYTSIASSQNIKLTETFNFIENTSYRFRWYDWTQYKALIKVVEEHGGPGQWPAIFINNYYIGSFDKLQVLIDGNIWTRIVNKEYETSCWVCYIARNNKSLDSCPFCFKKYTFFTLSDQWVDVHSLRFGKWNN